MNNLSNLIQNFITQRCITVNKVHDIDINKPFGERGPFWERTRDVRKCSRKNQYAVKAVSFKSVLFII